MAVGSTLLVGFKKHTNTWGAGAAFGAVEVGAGYGIEVESESIKIDPTLILNKGLSGAGTRLPGTLGNKLVSGDLVCPLYYRGLETLIALAMGTAVAPAQQGGTAAYEHAYNLIASHAGLYGTLVLPGSDHPAVREVPHAKVGGFTFDFTPNELAKLTVPFVGFDLLLNEGSLDADGIMTAVLPANGAQVVAGNPSFPFFLTVLMVDANSSVTEFVLTFVGTDESGDYQTETYTRSTDTKTWTSNKRWLSITSITGSALAGAAEGGDTIQVGYIPGANTLATSASISLPATADHELVRFDQVRVYCNDQAGADFVAGDEIFVDKLRISLQLSLRTDKVTTKFGNRIEEPNTNDYKTATIGFSFPEWLSGNQTWLQRRLRAAKQKIKVVVQGPLAATGYPCEISFFLNNVQFTSHTLNVSGPGEIPFDLEGEASRASANPTGLPTWANTQPLSMRLVNLRTTSALA
jgi:hypothetical protein